jgi:hypothetical protein
MARSSKCETKGNLRAAFPNSLRPVTRVDLVLPILHHAPQLHQEVTADSRPLFSPLAHRAGKPTSSSLFANEKRARSSLLRIAGARLPDARGDLFSPLAHRAGKPTSSSLFANEKRARSSLLRIAGARLPDARGDLFRRSRIAPGSHGRRSRRWDLNRLSL